MNIESPTALRACTSCQMCAAVCPKDAISVGLDADGFYRPAVDPVRCVDCGLCVQVCYKFDADIRQTSSAELDSMPLYAASLKDDSVVAQTTSGGVADMLARELIAEGYECIGVGYDVATDCAYHYVARTSGQTEGFRGSKYIQSQSMSAFKELVAGVRQAGRRYAVFGTPCQIYAVSRFLERRGLRERCLLVDLYCHGCPSMHVWRKYQSEVKARIGKPRFDSVNFRSKVKGWGNFYVVVVVDGVRAFVSSPRKDEFYTLFFSDQVLNEACSDCRLRSTMAYTDLRLGDFWGKLYSSDSRGVSAVTLATPRAESLFERLRPRLVSRRHEYADFLPYQSYGRNYTPDAGLRRRLLDSLQDRQAPLGDAVGIFYRSQGVKARLKRHVKHLLYYLPGPFMRVAKRLFYLLGA